MFKIKYQRKPDPYPYDHLIGERFSLYSREQVIMSIDRERGVFITKFLSDSFKSSIMISNYLKLMESGILKVIKSSADVNV